MGWEHELTDMLRRLTDAYIKDFPASMSIPLRTQYVWPIEVAYPDSDPRRKGKQLPEATSPNQEDMAWAHEYTRAAAYGTPEQFEAARASLLFNLRLHLIEQGFWKSEQLTGMPHGGLYLDGYFGARMGAEKKQDTEVIALLDEYARRFSQYASATATPLTHEILCCGERMPGGPLALQQSAIYRFARNQPQRYRDLQKGSINAALQTDTWLSLYMAMAMRGRGHDIGPLGYLAPGEATSLPLLKFQVAVQRWNGGHLAQYLAAGRPGANSVGGRCDWVLVDHRSIDSLRVDARPADITAMVGYSVAYQKPVPLAHVGRQAVSVSSPAPAK